MNTVKLVTQGRVQGVGYRRWFEKYALRLNLKGYVKNLATGEVEAVIIGSEETISKLIKYSYDGPLNACVTTIDLHMLDVCPQDQEFKILR